MTPNFTTTPIAIGASVTVHAVGKAADGSINPMPTGLPTLKQVKADGTDFATGDVHPIALSLPVQNADGSVNFTATGKAAGTGGVLIHWPAYPSGHTLPDGLVDVPVIPPIVEDTIVIYS